MRILKGQGGASLRREDRSSRRALYWAVAVSGVLFFVLNVLTPLSSDDYLYAFHYGTGAPIAGLGDIFSSQYVHYFTWGGRTVAHVFAQLFCWLGKPLFNLCNTLVYLAFTWFLYRHARLGKKDSVPVYLLAQLSFWALLPIYSENMLWLTGACNYLWCGAIVLGFLLFYRIHWDRPQAFARPGWTPLLFAVGVAAGWCNENTSGACLLLGVGFLIALWVRDKQVPLSLTAGCAGCAVGLALLVLAPGNALRKEYFQESSSLFIRYLERFETATQRLWDNALLLVLLFAALFLYAFFKGERCRELLLPAFFFVAGIACNYAMVLSPYYPERAMFGVFAFLTVACLQVLQVAVPWRREVVWAAMGCALVLFVGSYFFASLDCARTALYHRQQEEDILAQKAAGVQDVVTFTFEGGKTRQNVDYTGVLIGEDPSFSVNRYAAHYYGVNTLIARWEE